jgi:hypothetical protein
MKDIPPTQQPHQPPTRTNPPTKRPRLPRPPTRHTRPPTWLPALDPAALALARHTLSTHPLPPVTPQQQARVCGWLAGLGVGVVEGEGGYFGLGVSEGEGGGGGGRGRVLSACPPPLSLSQDRLRNGETLCALVGLLEPAAASHVQLAGLVHRSPKTVAAAEGNGTFGCVYVCVCCVVWVLYCSG